VYCIIRHDREASTVGEASPGTVVMRLTVRMGSPRVPVADDEAGGTVAGCC
jgi:hypothetical protein